MTVLPIMLPTMLPIIVKLNVLSTWEIGTLTGKMLKVMMIKWLKNIFYSAVTYLILNFFQILFQIATNYLHWEFSIY